MAQKNQITGRTLKVEHSTNGRRVKTEEVTIHTLGFCKATSLFHLNPEQENIRFSETNLWGLLNGDVIFIPRRDGNKLRVASYRMSN